MASSGYADIVYGKAAGVATITINRPRVYNAFTLNTIAELTAAFSDASADEEIGVVRAHRSRRQLLHRRGR